MTTPSRRLLADRLATFDGFLKAAASVELARRIATTVFTDRQSAIAARNLVGQLLDEAAADADTETFRALRALRASVTAHIAEVATDLPPVVTAAPAAILPSLALSYSIYGRIDRAAEIAERNRLPRPGFVPTRPIELLG